MQKVIQRTEAAIRQASRRRARTKDHTAKSESWERNSNTQRQRKHHNELIRQARRNRKEDWEAGLLAPRRDVGDKAITYGAVDIYNMQAPDKDPEDRPKWFHIREADRVVVIRGRDKGKIGSVTSVDKEKVAVCVRGMNLADVVVPEWMQQEDNDSRPIVAFAMAMPLRDVKLVFPLPDPETGIPRDVIIDRLVPINRTMDRDKRELTDGDRLIPGTNTIIPWPPKEEPDPEDRDDDTLRITVAEQTVRPVLLQPPMPLTVIDELRNKYSNFRTRHDWDYTRKKELEELKVEKRKELGRKMMTPMQQMRELKVRQGEEERQQELSEDQLARIGEVIAAEQAKVRGRVAEMER